MPAKKATRRYCAEREMFVALGPEIESDLKYNLFDARQFFRPSRGKLPRGCRIAKVRVTIVEIVEPAAEDL